MIEEFDHMTHNEMVQIVNELQERAGKAEAERDALQARVRELEAKCDPLLEIMRYSRACFQKIRAWVPLPPKIYNYSVEATDKITAAIEATPGEGNDDGTY